jgi:predicted kinase
MKQKILVLKGLPASGKSTFSKKLIDDNPGIWKRINKDDLRAMIDNSKWSKSNENFILKVRDNIVEQVLINGYSVIIDDTNLDNSHLEKMKLIANGFRHKDSNIDTIEVEVKDFTDVPLNVCIERDKLRTGNAHVGEKVIRNFYNKYLKKEIKPIQYNPELPDAIICDLDGTLAIKGNRDIYDESKIYLDTVNKPVFEILKGLDPKTTIIFCSGRTDSCYTQTLEWLIDNNIGHIGNIRNWKLLMRGTGDKRGDEIVKKEIYDTKIKGKYNINFVIDDRKKVKRMWVNEGLFVFDCNLFDEEY